MANLTSTTITGTLDATSTITGPASGASALNASNVSSGTLSSDRLPTVPTSKGGTGLTSIGSASQVLKVNSGGTALEFGEAGGGGNYELVAFTSSGTWTKDSGLQAVKVTVIGGGGGGGGGSSPSVGSGGGGGGGSIEFIPAPSIPGPVSVTVGSGGGSATFQGNGGSGGTSSFGTFLSATGGSAGRSATGGANFESAGSGSGGQINQPGRYGDRDGTGGDSAVGFGIGGHSAQGPANVGPFRPGTGFGSGGGAGGDPSSQIPGNDKFAGGPGKAGIVIVEEFY
jgi:hypothetical protein